MSDTKKMLAIQDGLGRIYECDCGVIHVAIRFADLAFSREDFWRLCLMFQAAAQQLETASDTSAEGRPFVVPKSSLSH